MLIVGGIRLGEGVGEGMLELMVEEEEDVDESAGGVVEGAAGMAEDEEAIFVLL